MNRALGISRGVSGRLGKGLTLLSALLVSPLAAADDEVALAPPNGVPACNSPCTSSYYCSSGGIYCNGVHRIFSPGEDAHLYATDPNEVANLTQNSGYTLEGLYFFSVVGVPTNGVYPNAVSSTTSLWRCPDYSTNKTYLTTLTPPPGPCAQIGYIATQPVGIFNTPLYGMEDYNVGDRLYTYAFDEMLTATQGNYTNSGIIGYVNVPGGLPPLPPPPSISASRKTISWAAVSGATVYQLWDADSGSVVGTTNGTSAYASVPFCESESFYVTACNSRGCGLPSNTVTIYVPPARGQVC